MNPAWIVIAAFNEDRAIAATLEALRPAGYSIVVVEDGSTDRTADIIRAYQGAYPGVHLVRHAINLGQGAALQTGIRYALEMGAEYLVTFDADGQHDPKDLPAILAPLRQGRAAVTLGTRFAGGGSAIGITRGRRLTLKAAVLFTRLTTGLRVTDAHNGLRGFTAAAAAQIRISQDGMAHASEILQEVKRLRLPYAEVPVTIEYTTYSLAKGQRISNAFHILWDYLKEMVH